MIFLDKDTTSEINQVRLTAGGVAALASNGVSAPSGSTYDVHTYEKNVKIHSHENRKKNSQKERRNSAAKKKRRKKQTTHDKHILSFHKHVHCFPGKDVSIFVDVRSSADVHFHLNKKKTH